MFSLKAIAVAAAAVGVSLLIIAPAANAAEPVARTGGAVRTAARVGSNETDQLTNLTPFTMNLESSWEDSGWGPGNSPRESAISTGYGSTWYPTLELFSGVSPWTVVYTFQDQSDRTDTVTLAATMGSQGITDPATCTITGPSAADYQCDGEGYDSDQWTVHATKSQINLSSADKTAFLNGMTNLCDGPNSANGHASCSFTPNAAPTYANGTTKAKLDGANSVAGCDLKGDDDTYQLSQDTTTTTSYDNEFSQSVQAGIDGVVTMGVSHTSGWGKSYAAETQYSNSQDVHADYGYLATPVWYPTQSTFIGDFTATLDGTTYDLGTVTIHGAGHSGTTTNGQVLGQYIMTQNQYKMNTAEWAQYCGTDTAPSTLA